MLLIQNIILQDFYKRRYKKIFPFFSLLVVCAVCFEHSTNALYEGSVELTLVYGLLPNNELDVLGVCWTLGVLFLFYLLFSFFSFLLKSKKRGWASLLISIWIVYVCIKHFWTSFYVTTSFTPRHSFLYVAPLLLVGGLIYLYVDKILVICQKLRWILLVVCIIASVIWYITLSLNDEFLFYIKNLILFTLWLIYAVGVNSRFLSCKINNYLSSISFEMYLAQMLVFRLIEKFNLLYRFGNGWIGFCITIILEVVGLIVFIETYKCFVKIIHLVAQRVRT